MAQLFMFDCLICDVFATDSREEITKHYEEVHNCLFDEVWQCWGGGD